MTDNGMKGRVKGLLAGPATVAETAAKPGTPAPVSPVALTPQGLADPDAQRQALQVLTLAQRTADEHVASAHRQAEKICDEARGKAQQIVQDAEVQIQDLRRDSEKALTDARASAAAMAKDAQAHAEKTRQDADQILAEAQSRVEEITKSARANADDLKDQAQQRYQDVVGSLATKREALQRQIEALEQFDRDYRTRLTNFMQTQLRALWVDEPKAGEIQPKAAPAKGGQQPVPAQRGS